MCWHFRCALFTSGEAHARSREYKTSDAAVWLDLKFLSLRVVDNNNASGFFINRSASPRV
jgi:hypothetical protein